MAPAAFDELCRAAAERNLHVELHTDHRGPAAKAPNLPAPVINLLRVTGPQKRVLIELRTTPRDLGVTSDRAMRLLPAR
jgi:hypothetical protein